MESEEVLMYKKGEERKNQKEGKHTPMQLRMRVHLLFHHVAEQQQVQFTK